MSGEPNEDAVSAREPGWRALAAGRWEAAREAFQASLREDETAEAFEGLSWAAWWMDDAEAVFGSRERAFQLYRDRGEPGNAARMATWLAADQLDFHGAFAVAGGWLRRARRLLDPLSPGPDHGWLAFHEGYVAYARGETSRASELAASAAELGRRFQVPDLEMLGLALEGAVLVACAEVAEGMACLDEAAATALEGGAVIPISGAWTCCFLVSACEAVRDYPRAFEWCDRIAHFSERYGSRYMLAFCRVHYGAVHLWRGEWQQAESELQAAAEDYSRSRPAFLGGVLARLAELRRRQGRWSEAESLLEDAGGREALLCRTRLALDRNESLRAAEMAERCLRRVPEPQRLERAPALELLVRARAQLGELSAAADALKELRGLERVIGTEPLGAAVAFADGILRAAAGDHAPARTLFEDAVDLFERSRAPFDAAQARIELAASLMALGRASAAEREVGASLGILTELGAEAEAARARRLLDGWKGERAPPGKITRRESEVLRLVCEGLTNRQIAERLFVSEHTIHRHVTNILRKLDVSSRAAAAAYAVRSGLFASSTD
jgi:DNA-binding NarL/FixJ family response regulator